MEKNSKLNWYSKKTKRHDIDTREFRATKRKPFLCPAFSAYRNTLRKYRARKNMPPWLTDEQLLQMQDFYFNAALFTAIHKIPYEVDHIEPINGPASCGLHVPWNLQAIPMKENRRKGNKIP